MRNIEGLTAVVTGASSGIGAATARLLAARGVNVVMGARRVERLDEVAREIAGDERGVGEPGTALAELAAHSGRRGTMVACACDVRDRASVGAMVDRAVGEFGRLDILVNNAGVMLLGAVAGLREQEWREMVEVNVLGVLHCMAAALPHMLAREPRESDEGLRADIVNVSSAAGRRVGPQGAVYAGTKAFVHMFSEGLRAEMSGRGVRVTIVAPGIVATELRGRTTDPEVKARWASAKPMRMLTSEDVAEEIVRAVSLPGRAAVSEVLVRPREQEH